jgi:hypothetical protein
MKHHHINCRNLENNKLSPVDGDGRKHLVDCFSLHVCVDDGK